MTEVTRHLHLGLGLLASLPKDRWDEPWRGHFLPRSKCYQSRTRGAVTCHPSGLSQLLAAWWGGLATRVPGAKRPDLGELTWGRGCRQ